MKTRTSDLWVIKAGGDLLARPAARRRVLSDVARLARRHNVVFVHGGGPQIEAALTKAGISHRFVKGRRVTSPKAMEIVEAVLSGTVNKQITADLCRKGVKALGLSGRDAGIVQARPLPWLGRAAKPTAVRAKVLKDLVSHGFTPIISTVSSDTAGRAVNVNADDAASAIAIALRATRLVFLTNVPGVLDSNRVRIPTLSAKRIQSYIDDGTITGGMIPKVQSCREAIRRGVGEVDILHGEKGVNPSSGTRIS